jgi:hypothetical protein
MTVQFRVPEAALLETGKNVLKGAVEKKREK